MPWVPPLNWSKEPPGLVSTFTPEADHHGRPGFLHGGLAATLLDETMAALRWALEGTHTVTATLELRYLQPVPLDGQPIRVEAWRDPDDAARAKNRPRRVQRVKGHLLLASGLTAVEARGLFVAVDADGGDE